MLLRYVVSRANSREQYLSIVGLVVDNHQYVRLTT